MKVKQLIKELLELSADHGDVEVRLQCDHGQELKRATWVGVSFIDDNSYMPSVSNKIDDCCNITVIEIQAF